MKIKLNLSAIMSVIHLIAVLSIVCFGTIYLSLSILTIPALTAAFIIGKDVIYRRFDVHDGLVKRFFSELASEIGMMRYFPLQLLIILQLVGMYGAEKTGMTYLSYPMLICISFVLALIVYLITYHVFYAERPSVTDVLIAMLFRLYYFLIVWIVMLLIAVFFGTTLMMILLFAGTILILAVETVAFLGIISFKKLRKELSDEDVERLGEDLLNRL